MPTECRPAETEEQRMRRLGVIRNVDYGAARPPRRSPRPEWSPPDRTPYRPPERFDELVGLMGAAGAPVAYPVQRLRSELGKGKAAVARLIKDAVAEGIVEYRPTPRTAYGPYVTFHHHFAFHVLGLRISEVGTWTKAKGEEFGQSPPGRTIRRPDPLDELTGTTLDDGNAYAVLGWCGGEHARRFTSASALRRKKGARVIDGFDALVDAGRSTAEIANHGLSGRQRRNGKRICSRWPADGPADLAEVADELETSERVPCPGVPVADEASGRWKKRPFEVNVLGLGCRWDGPLGEGDICPVCVAPDGTLRHLGPNDYCARCSRAGFDPWLTTWDAMYPYGERRRRPDPDRGCEKKSCGENQGKYQVPASSTGDSLLYYEEIMSDSPPLSSSP